MKPMLPSASAVFRWTIFPPFFSMTFSASAI